MNYKTGSAALGGTFDFFHLGHRALLDFAFKNCNFVFIGIVSDNFAKKLNKNTFQNFDIRKKQLEAYLTDKKLETRSQIIKLDDLYGNTLKDNDVRCVVVTGDTKAGAELINARRIELGLAPLATLIFKLISIDGLVISSTLIKQGVIDSEGFNFQKFLFGKSFLLPHDLRGRLKQPFGKVIKRPRRDFCDNFAITVGDQTTFDFLKLGLVPNLSIIDLKIQRVKKFRSYHDLGFRDVIQLAKVNNRAGEVSMALSRTIHECLTSAKRSVLLVNGEDDLATIPAVLLAPLGANVYYGLRNAGLVRVNVDPALKMDFVKILKEFDFKS